MRFILSLAILASFSATSVPAFADHRDDDNIRNWTIRCLKGPQGDRDVIFTNEIVGTLRQARRHARNQCCDARPNARLAKIKLGRAGNAVLFETMYCNGW